MFEVSPDWRRALSEGPLRSISFWLFFMFMVSVLAAAVSLMVKFAATPMRDIVFVTIALVLGLNGYGFWSVVQAYKMARTAIGREDEEILARRSYLISRMYFIALGCTLLCLRLAG